MKKLIVGLLAFFIFPTISWGETYTDWVDGTLRNPISQKVITINKYLRIYKHQINIAVRTLDAGDADVAEVLLLPKNAMVLKAWIRVITACPASSTVDLGYGFDVDYFGNAIPLDATGIAGTEILGSTTWDPGSITDGNEEAKEITVDGASIGDVVRLNFTVELEGLVLTGCVSAANTVTAVLSSHDAAAVDLDSGTITAIVDKAPLLPVPLLLTSSDTIDIKATTDTADVNIITGEIEVNALVMSTSASGFPQ